MPAIHATAVIEPGAEIAASAEIGPYCVIGPNVSIGEGCRLVANVHVAGHTSIGTGTVIQPFAVLGTPPQSTSYRGGPTRLVVGAHCDIRESVTFNTGTEEGRGVTEIGDHCVFMANSHVGHDCIVGSHVTFANCATLGGHCVIGDYVFIGGLSAAHQFTWIGAHAMISGITGVRGDVIPFGLANGPIARLSGVNSVGLRRRGFPTDTIRAVRAAYRMLFLGDGPFADRVAAVDAEHGRDEGVATILAFIRTKRRRPLCHPRRGPDEHED
jgi:UDP-N-acetylglucosamine acyltransferase